MKLKRFLLLIFAVCLLSLSIPFPTTASAAEDGPYLITPGVAREAPDCRLRYWVSPEADGPYSIYVQDSLPRITAYTGIRFIETSDELAADITFNVGNTSETFAENETHDDVVGWANYDTGEIMLSPLPRIVGVLGESDADVPRINLITHEVLHVLGLAHDETGREIMNPFLGSATTEFGTGDKAGMEFIRQYNNCSLAGIPIPEDRSNSAKYSTLGILFLVFIVGTTTLGAVLAIVAIVISKQRNPVLVSSPTSFQHPPAYPPPGWYRDPLDTARLRWWSGEEWTVYTVILPQP